MKDRAADHKALIAELALSHAEMVLSITALINDKAEVAELHRLQEAYPQAYSLAADAALKLKKGVRAFPVSGAEQAAAIQERISSRDIEVARKLGFIKGSNA